LRALRRRCGGDGLCTLLLLCAWSVALAASDGDGGAAVATTGASPVAQSANCRSVVIRYCQPRARTSSVVIDRTPLGLGRAPEQWEAVHAAGPDPDSDEIVIVGERIRQPTPSEVFDRYLGSPAGSTSLISRAAGGGARCTTISRSGATLCSSSGGVLPGMGTPVTTWSFSF